MWGWGWLPPPAALSASNAHEVNEDINGVLVIIALKIDFVIFSPFILHQIITARDIQSVIIKTIFDIKNQRTS